MGRNPNICWTLDPLTCRLEKSSNSAEPFALAGVSQRRQLGNLHPVAHNQGTGFGIETMNERKPLGQQKPMEVTEQRNKKPAAKPAKLGREVQARLGQQLRAMYDEVLNQGVPDRFTELLNRLDGNGNKDKH